MDKNNEPIKGDFAKMIRAELLGFHTFKFREALDEGTCHFIFMKSDGSLRCAHGTRNYDYIPEENEPKGVGVERPGYIETYFDLDKQEWRSLNITRLLWSGATGLNEYAIDHTKYGGDLEQDVMDMATKILNDIMEERRKKYGPDLFD